MESGLPERSLFPLSLASIDGIDLSVVSNVFCLFHCSFAGARRRGIVIGLLLLVAAAGWGAFVYTLWQRKQQEQKGGAAGAYVPVGAGRAEGRDGAQQTFNRL